MGDRKFYYPLKTGKIISKRAFQPNIKWGIHRIASKERGVRIRSILTVFLVFAGLILSMHCHYPPNPITTYIRTLQTLKGNFQSIQQQLKQYKLILIVNARKDDSEPNQVNISTYKKSEIETFTDEIRPNIDEVTDIKTKLKSSTGNNNYTRTLIENAEGEIQGGLEGLDYVTNALDEIEEDLLDENFGEGLVQTLIDVTNLMIEAIDLLLEAADELK